MWRCFGITLALILFIVGGCTTAEQLPQIREGMSQAEVERVMGSPDGFKRSGNIKAIEYKNRLISGWSWDRADYGFIFTNDKLTEWGAGQVRQSRTQPQIFILHSIQ
jgi:hypothetical protein